MFLMVYGSPAVQAAVGVDPTGTRPLRQAAQSSLHRELIEKRTAELKARIPVGGLREALIRALLFVAMARNVVDERGFALVNRIRQAESDISLPDFKAIVREQFCMLLIDTEQALAAIPSMLPADAGKRQKAFELITQVLGARGEYSAEDNERIQRVGQLFGVDAQPDAERPPLRRKRGHGTAVLNCVERPR